MCVKTWFCGSKLQVEGCGLVALRGVKLQLSAYNCSYARGRGRPRPD